MVDVAGGANNARRKIKSFIKLIVIGEDEEPSQIVSVIRKMVKSFIVLETSNRTHTCVRWAWGSSVLNEEMSLKPNKA